MDINKAWEKLNQEKFSNHSIKKEDIMNAIKQESSLTIYELKKGLKHKINWVTFFIIAFSLAAILSWRTPQVLPFWGAIILYYVAGYFGLRKQYKKMTGQIDPDLNTLSIMKNQLARIKKALQMENITGLFGAPLVCLCALLLPGLYRGESLMSILSEPKAVIIILACLLLMPPLIMILGGKLNKIAYGSHIEELEQNIEQMEELV